VSQVINKALPLPPPDALVLPPQCTTERTPEIGVKEAFVHMNGAEGVQSEDTRTHTQFSVLGVGLVSAFYGFAQCLLDRHRFCSLPLPLREPHVLILIPTGER
jgi:hypothetical protein